MEYGVWSMEYGVWSVTNLTQVKLRGYMDMWMDGYRLLCELIVSVILLLKDMKMRRDVGRLGGWEFGRLR